MGTATLTSFLATICNYLFFGGMVLLIATFVARAFVAKVKEPSCGQCRYSVSGLDALRCPECGGDLREVGILTPSMRRRTPVWVYVLIWSMIVPMPANGISTMIERALTTFSRGYIATLGSPHSGTHQNVIVATTTGTPDDRITIVLTLDDGSAGGTIDVNPDDMTYRLRTSSGMLRDWSPDFNQDAVLEWYRAHDLDTEKKELVAEAQNVLTQVNSFASGNMSGTATAYSSIVSNTTQSVDRPRWFRYVAAAFWFLVWLVGALIIVRIVRVERRAAPATS